MREFSVPGTYPSTSTGVRLMADDVRNTLRLQTPVHVLLNEADMYLMKVPDGVILSIIQPYPIALKLPETQLSDLDEMVCDFWNLIFAPKTRPTYDWDARRRL